MTREEALIKVNGYLTDLISSEDYDEVEEIMSALTQKSCDDAISKQYLLDNCVIDKVTMPYVPISKIKNAPPVTSPSKTGHWIIVDDCEQFIAKCSECGRIEDSRMINKYPYCHCGAKMAESENI